MIDINLQCQVEVIQYLGHNKTIECDAGSLLPPRLLTSDYVGVALGPNGLSPLDDYLNAPLLT